MGTVTQAWQKTQSRAAHLEPDQLQENSMKRTTRLSMLAAGVAALGLAASLAVAHPGGYGPGGYGPGGYGPGAGMGPGMGGMHPGMMGAGPGPQGMHPGMMGAGPGMMGMHPGMMGWGPQAMQGADFAAVFDSRLAASKAELKITAEQESAWQAYATQLKTRFETMQAFRASMHAAAPAGNAAERTEQHAAMMKQRAAMAEQTAKAVKDLYAALSPEQRAIADQRLFAMGPRFGRAR
jgi:hypothetical protein